MKKRFTSAVCCILALCAMLTSCSNKDNGLFTVSVGGNAYDVMVVGDPDVWKSEAGRTLFDVWTRTCRDCPNWNLCST